MPDISALENLTFVLGSNMYTAAKNSHVITHDATSSNADITGVIKLKWNMVLSVELSKMVMPLAHIISMGSMSSMAV